jgi:hypothetical protein
VRAHRAVRRRVAQEVGELTRAVCDPRAARSLAKLVIDDVRARQHPTTHDVAVAVATRCSDDGQRSGLAAYLHVCRDVSFDTLGDLFAISPAAARRLVERGTGTTPITAGDDCRGWALVTPRPRRTPAEHHAAAGHLSLCRRCRNKLRAHTALEHRVAVAGSATFGASVAAAVGRAVAGGQAVTGTASALTAPILALSTAAALTAGVGAVAADRHQNSGPGRSVIDTHFSSTPSARPQGDVSTTARPTPASGGSTGADGVRVSPGPLRSQQPPAGLLPLPTTDRLPGRLDVPAPPLPTISGPVTVPSVPPLPLPSVSVSSPAVAVPGLP